jgi:Icc-related predicted phosphoesterase
MEILAVSDQVADAVYRGCTSGRFDDVDLAVSCGDLPYSYLEFIVTMLGVPCCYVHGNHDHPEYRANGVVLTEPGGWIDLDGTTVERKGLLLAGLEGSIRYKPDAPYQYREPQMAWKAWGLVPSFLLNRLRRGRYVDILVTHSPPYGIHDGEDLAHRGFRTFLGLMDWFKPRYLLHGHKHVYGPEPTHTRHGQTEVVNVYPYRVIST